jgi:hypothetical protein
MDAPKTIPDMFSNNGGKNPILKETYAGPKKKKPKLQKLKDFFKGSK